MPSSKDKRKFLCLVTELQRGVGGLEEFFHGSPFVLITILCIDVLSFFSRSLSLYILLIRRSEAKVSVPIEREKERERKVRGEENFFLTILHSIQVSQK